MADIKIDGKVFQERVSHFINAWKADKRSGDALFGGASSIVINMGKVEENPEFHKNNAMHVRAMGPLPIRFDSVSFRPRQSFSGPLRRWIDSLILIRGFSSGYWATSSPPL